MDIRLFLEEFEKANDKAKYVKKHIVNEYVDYGRKIVECENIAEKANHKSVDGRKVYWRQSGLQRLCFILTLIRLYTDIDVKGVNEYDELCKNGTMGYILSSIPEEEYEEFCVLVKFASDDLYENERSIVANLERKFESFGLLSDGIKEVLMQDGE